MSAWICPDCGEPNDTQLCNRCKREAPIVSDTQFGSDNYFGAVYGRKGCFGLPKFYAIVILVLIIAFQIFTYLMTTPPTAVGR